MSAARAPPGDGKDQKSGKDHRQRQKLTLLQAPVAELDRITDGIVRRHELGVGLAEQLEEEALARAIMDKLKLIGDDKGGLYLFDRDIESMTVTSIAGSPK